MSDPYDLERFVRAQAPIYDRALAEIRRGRKQSHWMWFIFPQRAGLGLSETSRHFAIGTLAETRAYLAHPLLGARLTECAEAVLTLKGASAIDIFGSPDDMKLRSSATLFAAVSPPASVFHRLLDAFFDGTEDEETLRLIADAN